MTPSDVQILVQQGEGATLEFKESLSSAFARELVALANTIGGKILLGVRDDGTVTGVTCCTASILLRRRARVSGAFAPPAFRLFQRFQWVRKTEDIRNAGSKPPFRHFSSTESDSCEFLNKN